MKIGIHGQPEAVELSAAFEGAIALGARPIWRSASDYRRGEVESIFDAVFVSGTRRRGGDIATDYSAAGVPVLVIDYGYLRRVYRRADFLTGHWQIGLGRLNWLPPVDLPDHRFASLDLPLVSLRALRADSPIFVCGQHVGDPSHGLEADGIADWAQNTIAELRRHTARPIAWRPHPDSQGVKVSGADLISTEPFAEALREAWAVVTISSNSGHEALLAGVPVFCDPRAMYAALANLDLADIEEPFFPDPDQRWRHFSRLAWAQWTLDELRTGAPLQFLLEAFAGRWPLPSEPASGPPELAAPAPSPAAAKPPAAAEPPPAVSAPAVRPAAPTPPATRGRGRQRAA